MTDLTAAEPQLASNVASWITRLPETKCARFSLWTFLKHSSHLRSLIHRHRSTNVFVSPVVSHAERYRSVQTWNFR